MSPDHERAARRRQIESGNRLALLIVAGLALLWVIRAFAADPQLGTVTGTRFFSISFGPPEEPAPPKRRSLLRTWTEPTPASAQIRGGPSAPEDARTTEHDNDRAAGAEGNATMNDVTGYLSSLFLSVAIALVVALVLRRPLGELLVELCGNERRARFWAAFTSITLVLGALLGTLLSIPNVGEPAWEGIGGLRGLLVGLRSGTFLMLLVIAAMGFVMLIGITRAPVAKPPVEANADAG